MAHQGVLIPEVTMTPVKTGDTVTSLTVACTMHSAPLVETMESRTVDGQTSDYGVTVTDEDNKVALGSRNFTWTVPTAHQSGTEFYVVDETDGDNILMEDGNTLVADIPYKVNWKYITNRSNENHRKLIKASADYKSMMSTLTALQKTYTD